MNRSVLLKKARDAGFTGKAELPALVEFLRAEGMNTDEIVTGKAEDGSEIRTPIKDIWAKTVHLMCDGGEQVKMHDPPGADDAESPAEDATDTTEKAADRPQFRKNYRPGIGWTNGPGKVEGKGAEPRDRRGYGKKQYDLRAKRGGTVYEDADTAEAAGAFFRYQHSEARRFDYGQKRLDEEILQKANVESINTDGGVLVPDEFKPQLMYLTEQYGVCRQLVNVQPMSRDFMSVPRCTANISMVGLSEGGTITDTSPTFDAVNITAKKFGALVKFSSELFEDSAINITDTYSRLFAEAQAIIEDKCVTIADGSATYNGIVGLTGALPSGAYVSATGSGWSAMLLADFFTSALGVVENVNPSRLAFLCSRQFFAQVMLKLGVIGSSSGYIGGGNSLQDMTNGAPFRGGTGPHGMWQGYPVYFSQVMPTATAGSEQRACYFGDFAGAVTLGDRRQMAVATSDQRYFDSDQYAIRVTSRFGVNVHGDGRGSTYGPVIALTST